MSMKASRRVIAVAALVLLLRASLSAQITTGTVFGTVKDSQGAVVPGATVTLTSETKGTKLAPTVTTPDGNYVFPGVTPDVYSVEVTLEGFKTLIQQGIRVSGGERLVVPALTLSLGGRSEVVEVKAESPVIQAASGERSFVVQ